MQYDTLLILELKNQSLASGCDNRVGALLAGHGHGQRGPARFRVIDGSTSCTIGLFSCSRSLFLVL